MFIQHTMPCKVFQNSGKNTCSCLVVECAEFNTPVCCINVAVCWCSNHGVAGVYTVMWALHCTVCDVWWGLSPLRRSHANPLLADSCAHTHFTQLLTQTHSQLTHRITQLTHRFHSNNYSESYSTRSQNHFSSWITFFPTKGSPQNIFLVTCFS